MSPCLLQVTYDPKVQARSVTLGGDLFDPQGTATGGTKCAIEVSHSCKTPVICELEYMFHQFGKGSKINALGNTPNSNCPFRPFACLSFCFYLFVLFHDWYHSHIMFHAFQVHGHRIPQSWSSCRNWMRHKRLYKAKIQSYRVLSRSWTPIRKWQKSMQLLPFTAILYVREELMQV